VTLDSGVVAPRAGLARPVPILQLREAVDYSHFWGRPTQVHLLEDAVRTSTSWEEVLDRLGFASGSGSARARIRRQCELNGLDTSGLSRALKELGLVSSLRPQSSQLRNAGPHIVAAALTLVGVPVSFAPEGVAYDLIGDFLGLGPKRIQVKSVAAKSWQCNLSRKAYSRTGRGGHKRAFYAAEEIDYFACVTSDLSVFLIPIGAVEGRGSISLRRCGSFRVPFADKSLPEHA
jgi:hypothetical protein